MSKRSVSVIMPSLNEFEALPPLIDDLARQTRKPDRIIVAEGGKVTKMRTAVKKLCRNRLECEVDVVKGGTPGIARNIGAKHATLPRERTLVHRQASPERDRLPHLPRRGLREPVQVRVRLAQARQESREEKIVLNTRPRRNQRHSRRYTRRSRY